MLFVNRVSQHRVHDRLAYLVLFLKVVNVIMNFVCNMTVVFRIFAFALGEGLGKKWAKS